MVLCLEKFQNAIIFPLLYDLQSAIFEIFNILGFPTDSNVQISKCHKFCKTWPITKKHNSLHFPMVSNVLIKFGWDPMKIVGEVAFENHSIGEFYKVH